ncbi:hypothetical protein Y032_0056g2667 [Ancylostoma ceylanicum]|uniref:BPTI/Kunitz inhibitor domain-containing protein n=1 Tax=Ancylostoma ceylanicum TaxID=53326 RepID=A0A016U558_9BILA|nr:hypothetical protein Y032_0056g2667 [Ancylostoma ceylanicum]
MNPFSFGYDTAQGKCVEFMYGGCKGNENNFVAMENCEKECLDKGPKFDKLRNAQVSDRVKRSLASRRTSNRIRPLPDTLTEKPSIRRTLKKKMMEMLTGPEINDEEKRRNLERVLWSRHGDILMRHVDPCLQPIPEHGFGKSSLRYAFDKYKRKCIQIRYYQEDRPTSMNNFFYPDKCRDRCEKRQFEEPNYKAILGAKGIFDSAATQLG